MSQVNKGKVDLEKALQGLEKKEDPLAKDKEKLENAITRIEEEMTEMNPSDYTSDSWKNLEDVYTERYLTDLESILLFFRIMDLSVKSRRLCLQ